MCEEDYFKKDYFSKWGLDLRYYYTYIIQNPLDGLAIAIKLLLITTSPSPFYTPQSKRSLLNFFMKGYSEGYMSVEPLRIAIDVGSLSLTKELLPYYQEYRTYTSKPILINIGKSPSQEVRELMIEWIIPIEEELLYYNIAIGAASVANFAVFNRGVQKVRISVNRLSITDMLLPIYKVNHVCYR